MDHSADTNKNIYQCSPALQEIAKVGRYFDWLESNKSTNGNILKPNCIYNSNIKTCHNINL